MIRILRIDPSHALYAAECSLREAVLLKDAGYDFARYVRDYPHEAAAEHFVAVLDHPVSGPQVLGTALLRAGYTQPHEGKVMQVAVHPQRRGEGIGTRLMIAVEARAFGELGLSRLFCHAQQRAVAFYDGLGWAVEGEPFVEAGIPHRRMAMHAADRDAAAPGPRTGPAADTTADPADPAEPGLPSDGEPFGV